MVTQLCGSFERLWGLSLLFLSIVLCGFPLAQAAELVPPLIEHPGQEDLDGNLVVDRLETQVNQLIAAQRGEELVRMEVVLYEPYEEADLETFRSLGGSVIHTFEVVSYGFSGTIPAKGIADLVKALNVDNRLCVISDDPKGSADLDYSTRHVRARSSDVWGAGYDGNSNTTIAILDTGIDDAHTDFSGRVSAGWTDTTSEAYGSKVDYNSHGSHVAGIALGSGAVYSGSVSSITTTMSGFLPSSAGYGYFDFVEVKSTGTNGLQLDLNWNGGGTTQVSSKDTDWNWMAYNNSSIKPNTISYNITTTGIYKPFFGNSSGAGNAAYSGLETFNYSNVGDGYNLFRGMAPDCTLLGVKVLLNSGSGNSTDWGEGLDWCVTNRDTYNIRVINMSLSLNNGVTNATLDNKVNNAVANGIVVVCSAGNSYPTYTIASPANAAKSVAVGAINDGGAMTYYSSNGFGGQNKPDVVAPGGSNVAGTEITSVESNDGDAQNNMTDRQSNDYQHLHGTSMSSPMVAGLAALLIDGQVQGGDPWNSTEDEVKRIKAIMLMTATETNQSGEYNWNGGSTPSTPSGNNPSLNRGARDLVEGFGRINADAAIEAMTLTMAINTGTMQETFGDGSLNRKAMARNLSLDSSKSYTFSLICDSGNLDCDLYLYDGTPDANGNPTIRTSATTASNGTSEYIYNYSPPTTGTYYLVGKFVTGSGTGNYHLEVGEVTPAVRNWPLY